MALTPLTIRVFANAGKRMEHLDASGGGTITRMFYVEPYAAYPFAVTMLKGTVVNTTHPAPADPQPGDTWARIKPHNDPFKPWFYCDDVKVIPLSTDAVTGMPITSFTPSNDITITPTPAGASQQQQVSNVLDCVDDLSFGSIVDFAQSPPLTPEQIAAGGIQFGDDGSGLGKCGAFLVATYTPLIFLDGLATTGDNIPDPFDYVNPTWTPIEINTQTGRNLFLLAPWQQNILIPSAASWGGLTDTFNKAEVIWEFSITRLMVPFLPMLTLGILNNKINNNQIALGNAGFPLGTCRLVAPEPPPLKRAPDGSTFYDITLKYMVRKLYDAYFDVDTFLAHGGPPPSGFIKGWVDWNHHYGIPASRIWPNAQSNPPGYYPVHWNDQVFQALFGNIGFSGNHPLYLRDTDLPDALNAIVQGVSNPSILQTEFAVGFQSGQ